MAEKLIIETEQEEDRRWFAEVAALPGTLSYGKTRVEAVARVQALALRVLADRLQHGEAVPSKVLSCFDRTVREPFNVIAK